MRALVGDLCVDHGKNVDRMVSFNGSNWDRSKTFTIVIKAVTNHGEDHFLRMIGCV